MHRQNPDLFSALKSWPKCSHHYLSSKTIHYPWASILIIQNHISQISTTSVREWMSDKGRQWSDLGPFKIKDWLFFGHFRVACCPVHILSLEEPSPSPPVLELSSRPLLLLSHLTTTCLYISVWKSKITQSRQSCHLTKKRTASSPRVISSGVGGDQF